jgi:ribosomal protein S18 acetylase RimI-like enzyme
MLLYRQGSIADLKQLKELGVASYSEYRAVLTEDNWETMDVFLNNEAALIQLIEKANVFVCADQDLIIGMAYLIPKGNPTHIYPADWSYIRMVGVNPNYRGKGIAKQLTQHCIDFAKQTGENVIALHTSEYMDAARHIYESLGFECLKEIDPIYGKRYWLYKLVIL